MTAINLQLNTPEWHLHCHQGGVKRWMTFGATLPEHSSMAVIDQNMTREATALMWTVYVYDVQTNPPSDHYLKLAKERHLPHLAASVYLRTARKELLDLDQYLAEGVVYIWLPTNAFDSIWNGIVPSQEAIATLITTRPESGLTCSSDSVNAEPVAWLLDVENPILMDELEISIRKSPTAIQFPVAENA